VDDPHSERRWQPGRGPARFHVYRLIYNAAEGCPTCRDPDELVAALVLAHPDPAVRLGKRIYWRDAAVTPGTGHAYLVVPVTVGGHEGSGAGTYRAWLRPPPAPTTLQAEAGDRQVRLTWTPPPALPDGQQLLGYNLYRRPAGGAFAPIALNSEPLREPLLTDLSGKPAGQRFTGSPPWCAAANCWWRARRRPKSPCPRKGRADTAFTTLACYAT